MPRLIKVAVPGYGRTQTKDEPTSPRPADVDQTSAPRHSTPQQPSSPGPEDDSDQQEILSHYIATRLKPGITDGGQEVDLAATLGKTMLSSPTSTTPTSTSAPTDAEQSHAGARDRVSSTTSTSRPGADHRRRGSGSSRHSASSVDAHSDAHHSVRSRSSFGDAGSSYLPADLGRPGTGKAPVFPLKAGAQTNRSKYKRETSTGTNAPAAPDVSAPASAKVTNAAPTAVSSNEALPSLSLTTKAPSPPASVSVPRRSNSQLSLKSSRTSSSGGTRSTHIDPRTPSSIKSGQSSTGLSNNSAYLPGAPAPQSIFAKPEHTRRPVVDLLPKFLKSRASVDSTTVASGQPPSVVNNPYLAARRESRDKNKKAGTRGGGGGSMAVLGAALATSQTWTPASGPPGRRRESSIQYDRRPSGTPPSIVSRNDSLDFAKSTRRPSEESTINPTSTTESWVMANQAGLTPEEMVAQAPDTSLPTRRDVFAVKPRPKPSAT
ncbi:hypothetical protein ACM66B_005814 [Microbotryomycetes sp. NB124-2]